MAKLVSLGSGVLPKGFVWEMRPKSTTLGRQIANDFVIPSNLIAPQQLRFQFNGNAFLVSDLEERGRCSIDGTVFSQPTMLANGTRLRVGVEEFQYEFIGPTTGPAPSHDPLAASLQLTLGIISEFHASLNIQEVLDNALDAVLRVTRTKRAYAFMVDYDDEGDAELREVAARCSGGKPVRDEDREGYTISQSMIERVLSGSDAVMIEDAGAEQVDTETIRRFKLKSVVCLPLLTYDPHTGRKRVMGVLYADSLMPTGQLPPHCRPTLHMLTQIVTSTIVKWQNYTNMQEQFANYQRSVHVLSKDLEVCGEQVQALQAQMAQRRGFNQMSRDELAFELDAVCSRLGTVQASLQRLQYLRTDGDEAF